MLKLVFLCMNMFLLSSLFQIYKWLLSKRWRLNTGRTNSKIFAGHDILKIFNYTLTWSFLIFRDEYFMDGFFFWGSQTVIWIISAISTINRYETYWRELKMRYYSMIPRSLIHVYLHWKQIRMICSPKWSVWLKRTVGFKWIIWFLPFIWLRRTKRYVKTNGAFMKSILLSVPKNQKTCWLLLDSIQFSGCIDYCNIGLILTKNNFQFE